MDVDMEPGVDFVEEIEEAVGSCDVFVAVIGPSWLTVSDGEGARRLDSPQDFVRLEVAAALGRKVRVIPCLVEGARMPRAAELPEDLKALSRRQAVEVTHKGFHRDAVPMIRAIGKALGMEPASARQTAKLQPVDYGAEDLRSSWMIYEVAFLWHGYAPPTAEEHFNAMTPEISRTKNRLHAAIDAGELAIVQQVTGADGYTRTTTREHLLAFTRRTGERPEFLYRSEPVDDGSE